MHFILACCATLAFGQARRKVIVDEDTAGPGGSDMRAILLLLQSPQLDPLGITVVTGDQWLKEEIQHALRVVEITGRRDVPVVPGAEYPLVRTRAETLLREKLFGSVNYMGAWTPERYHSPDMIPPLKEGAPKLRPSSEDAAHFLVRMVHKYPHQVTILALGPMTNIALAVRLDPRFAELAQELVFMGGSLNPQTDDPEFATNPRHEFNLWFDPEAAHIVLTAHWKKIVCTPVDISIKTHLNHELLHRISQSPEPAAQYLARYDRINDSFNYMWDELAVAALLDPSMITATKKVYMDVDLDKGSGYGNTLTWTAQDKPALDKQLVDVQMDLDTRQLYGLFEKLMTRPSPAPAANK